DAICRLQASLRCQESSGQGRELLVLATLSSEADASTRFERASLAPLAARLGQDELRAKRTGVVEALGLAVGLFPVDALLPTLIDATNRPRMTDALRALLDPDGTLAVEAIEVARMGRTTGW